MKKTNKVFNGAIITVIMRWSDRLIGLVSMVILARLLVPSDFGLVAMASLVVGFIDVFLDLGVNQALIHNKDAEPDDYHTAWSLRLVQAVIAGGVIFHSTPYAVDYFSNPLLVDVLQVMSLSIIIGGFENIGIVNFQKEMNFGKDFKFFFTKRIVSFIVTLSIAYYFHSYWAMVLGSLAGRVVGVVISYVMHSFRPHFSMSRVRKIWSFSQWVLFKNMGGYLDASMDRLFVGMNLDSKALGGYTISGEISSLPTTELLAPLGRVMFPAFVEKKDDMKEFSKRVRIAIGVQGLVAIPACIGLMIVCYDLVFFLLGEQWLFIVPIIKIMALGHLISAMIHSCVHALMALGKVRVQALIAWLQAAVYVFIIYHFESFVNADAEYFATVRLFVVLIGAVIFIGISLFEVHILTVWEFLSVLVRPVFATIVMSMTLYGLDPLLISYSYLFRLGVEVILGVVIYTLVIIVMWLVFKRPNGAESYLLKNILYRQ